MSKLGELATAYAKRRYDPEGGEYHWNMASAETREAEIQDAKGYIREMLSMFPDVGLKAVPVEATWEMANAAVDATGAGAGMTWVNLSPQKMFRIGHHAAVSAAPDLLTEEDNG